MQVLDGEPWYDSPPKGKASTKTAKESADKNREYREKRRQQQQSSGGGEQRGRGQQGGRGQGGGKTDCTLPRGGFVG